MLDRKQIKRREKKKEKRERGGKNERECQRGTETRQKRPDGERMPTRATRPGISVEFSRVLLSAPNPLASSFSSICVSVPEDLCIYTGRTVTASENDAGGCRDEATEEVEVEEEEEEDLLPR